MTLKLGSDATFSILESVARSQHKDDAQAPAQPAPPPAEADLVAKSELSAEEASELAERLWSETDGFETTQSPVVLQAWGARLTSAVERLTREKTADQTRTAEVRQQIADRFDGWNKLKPGNTANRERELERAVAPIHAEIAADEKASEILQARFDVVATRIRALLAQQMPALETAVKLKSSPESSQEIADKLCTSLKEKLKPNEIFSAMEKLLPNLKAYDAIRQDGNETFRSVVLEAFKDSGSVQLDNLQVSRAVLDAPGLAAVFTKLREVVYDYIKVRNAPTLWEQQRQTAQHWEWAKSRDGKSGTFYTTLAAEDDQKLALCNTLIARCDSEELASRMFEAAYVHYSNETKAAAFEAVNARFESVKEDLAAFIQEHKDELLAEPPAPVKALLDMSEEQLRAELAQLSAIAKGETAAPLEGAEAGTAASATKIRLRDSELTASLEARLGDGAFVLSPDTVQQLQDEFQLSREELLLALVPVAKAHARPEISHYNVGAAALADDGRVFLGVNLEFAGLPLSETVHGEQFTVANAFANKAAGLEEIAVSAEPCGHCRQFLNEVSPGIKVITPDQPQEELKDLLPHNFGPKDLGVEATPMQARSNGLTLCEPSSDPLTAAALEAANRSWSPAAYSNSPSGIALQLADGSIYSGSYLENAAFNPSLPPLQSAIAGVVAAGKEPRDIRKVVLVEVAGAPVSQRDVLQPVLKRIAPEAELTTIEAKA